METGPYTRINGEMLASFKGKSVCMLGKLKRTLEETNAFEIETSDGKSVLVKLKQPIRDMLSSIVEVYGTVDDKCNIACLNYATFDQEAIENFDMNLYNETVQMTHQLPSHYIQV